MITVLHALWEFFITNFWICLILGLCLVYKNEIYKKFIFDPLAGGNGKIQMDEMAKGVVIGIIIWAVQRDGYRTHEWAYFTDTFYAALLAGLFAIAAIKPVASVMKHNKTKNDNEKESDSIADSH